MFVWIAIASRAAIGKLARRLPRSRSMRMSEEWKRTELLDHQLADDARWEAYWK